MTTEYQAKIFAHELTRRRSVNERASLSPDMAIRIEKAFGVSMEALMRMQNSFDIAQAHRREGDIRVQRYVPNSKTDPHSKLI